MAASSQPGPYLADPPFNLAKTTRGINDKMRDKDYLAWCGTSSSMHSPPRARRRRNRCTTYRWNVQLGTSWPSASALPAFGRHRHRDAAADAGPLPPLQLCARKAGGAFNRPRVPIPRLPSLDSDTSRITTIIAISSRDRLDLSDLDEHHPCGTLEPRLARRSTQAVQAVRHRRQEERHGIEPVGGGGPAYAV